MRGLIYLLLGYFTLLQLPAQKELHIQLDLFDKLPPLAGKNIQPGLAGAFIGTHGDALIIAGGANFPNGPFWEGGNKVWWKEAYIYHNGKWQMGDLSHPVAYGVSISLPEGVVCIGGNDADTLYDEVFLLQWNAESNKLHIAPWPKLPTPLANMAGAKVGNAIYVAGGDSPAGPGNHFLSLDLTSPATIQQGWQSLSSWPGPPLTHAVAVAQNDGEYDAFYLMGGRELTREGSHNLWSGVYSYHPRSAEWKKRRDIQDTAGKVMTRSAGTAIASGSNHILLLGGADGEMLNQFVSWGNQLAAEENSGNSVAADSILSIRDSLLTHHPGFRREILAYHTLTDTWTHLGDIPQGSQVTTTAIRWQGDILIPTGEISPGIRTPDIWTLQLEQKAHFGWLNYLILGAYLLGLLVMGFFFSRNQHSTEDFFKGGKRIPWWAAGLSIFGTQLSAITFMAVPAKTFATNWLYFFLSMTILLVTPFIIQLFLPFYRRLNLTTAYEYLERRFNVGTRIIGSLMYVLLQLGRMGIVLLLPSLALSVVTGLDVNLCILLMAVLSIAYTVLGGIEAVIWTDVIQVIVLMTGALLALILIPFQLEGGLAEMGDIIQEHQKLKLLDLRLDISNPTFWVVLIGGFATNLIQYGSDQTVVQRYLTTRDEKQAAKSIWTGNLMALPSTLIFFSLGTALFVFYRANPAELSPVLENTDAIFPWYIVNELPVGLSGLLIAAIFAAAMSSLDSSMNSVATVVTTDYYRRFAPAQTEKKYLRFARGITAITGIMGTLLALYMAQGGITSLWDQFNVIVGLFAGGLGGIFLLGILDPRANGIGAITGLLVSGLVQFMIRNYTDVHLLLYAFTGMITAYLVGYAVSLIAPSNKDTSKLTYQSLKSS